MSFLHIVLPVPQLFMDCVGWPYPTRVQVPVSIHVAVAAVASWLWLIASGWRRCLSTGLVAGLIIVVIVEPPVIYPIVLSAIRAQPVGIVNGAVHRRMSAAKSLLTVVITFTTTTLESMSIIIMQCCTVSRKHFSHQ